MNAVLAPGRTPERPGDRPPLPVGALTVGVLLVTAGAVWLAEEAGLVDVSWRTGLALVVLAVGVLLVLTARARETGGLVALGIVTAALLVLTTVLPTAPPLGAGAGDRTYRPGTATELAERYELGMGNLVLDLRALEPAEEVLTTEVEVGMGEVEVLLPDGVAVQVDASAGTGEVEVDGTSREGVSPRVTETVGSGEVAVELDVHVGLGSVAVTR